MTRPQSVPRAVAFGGFETAFAQHKSAAVLVRAVVSVPERETTRPAAPASLPCLHRSLAGLPVRYFRETATYVVPLIQPIPDDIPLAVALELTAGPQQGNLQADQEQPSSPLPAGEQTEAFEDCFAIRYVLDGQLQQPAPGPPRSELETGDSLLTLHRPSKRQRSSSLTASPAWSASHAESPEAQIAVSPNPPAGSSDHSTRSPLSQPVGPAEGLVRPVQWTAASLLFLLPTNLGQSGSPPSSSQPHTAAPLRPPWLSHPVIGTLTPSELSAIITASTRSCQQLASSASQSSLPRPSAPQPDEPLNLSPSLLTALRALPEALVRSLMEACVRPGMLPGSVLPRGSFTAASRAHMQKHPHGPEAQHGHKGSFLADGVMKRAMRDLVAMRLPNQSNRLALVFDPLNDPVPFTFGVEVFEKGHKTAPHSHAIAHELFFILAGEGEGFCEGERFPVSAGDVVVFPPQSVHGIDNHHDSRMYCLELMLPNDMFAELVEAGTPTGGLNDEDLCVLIAAGCGGS